MYSQLYFCFSTNAGTVMSNERSSRLTASVPSSANRSLQRHDEWKDTDTAGNYLAISPSKRPKLDMNIEEKESGDVVEDQEKESGDVVEDQEKESGDVVEDQEKESGDVVEGQEEESGTRRGTVAKKQKGRQQPGRGRTRKQPGRGRTRKQPGRGRTRKQPGRGRTRKQPGRGRTRKPKTKKKPRRVATPANAKSGQVEAGIADSVAERPQLQQDDITRGVAVPGVGQSARDLTHGSRNLEPVSMEMTCEATAAGRAGSTQPSLITQCHAPTLCTSATQVSRISISIRYTGLCM